jgi:hypothetical protein
LPASKRDPGRGEVRPPPTVHVEDADSVDSQHPLVAAGDDHVTQRPVNGHDAEGMRRVDNQASPNPVRETTEPAEIVAGSGEVADMAHGDRASAPVDRRQDLVVGHHRLPAHRADLDAARTEPLPGEKDRGELALTHHDVVPGAPVDTLGRHVQARGGAGEERDVLGAPAQTGRESHSGPVRRDEEALASGHAVALVEEELGRGREVGTEDGGLPARREVRDMVDADERRLRDQAGHWHLTRTGAGPRHGGRARAPGRAPLRTPRRRAPGGGWTSPPGPPRSTRRRDSGW